jgi:catechol 2,3-dioxygenase-like lactoylglutathione lyase family enzyme
MPCHLALVSILVRDYEEAIAYYTAILGFQLVENTALEDGKRWVVVGPFGADGCRLLLAKAKRPEEIAAIGKQSAGRVFLFLQTDDFWTDYRALLGRGVQFLEQPRNEIYGMVAVFSDLYGTKWDLMQLRPKGAGPG